MKGMGVMKGFFKFLGIFVTAVAAIIGVLVVVDKILNKNRIKGDYLECDTLEDFEDEEDIQF